MKKNYLLILVSFLYFQGFAQSNFSVGVVSGITSVQQPYYTWMRGNQIALEDGLSISNGIMAQQKLGRLIFRANVSHYRTSFNNMDRGLALYAFVIPEEPASFLSAPVLTQQTFQQIGGTIGIGVQLLQRNKWHLNWTVDGSAIYTVSQTEHYRGYYYNSLSMACCSLTEQDVVFNENKTRLHQRNIQTGLSIGYQLTPNYTLTLHPFVRVLEQIENNTIVESTGQPEYIFGEATQQELKSYGLSVSLLKTF